MFAKANQWLMASACLVLMTLAVSLSWLRWGIDQHPIYHQWVEAQVSKSIGQDLKLEAFEVKLAGTSLQLNLTGLETKGGLTLARLTLGVDLLGSLQASVLRLSHVKAIGLAIEIRQQEDGRWGPIATHETNSQTPPQLMLAVAAIVPQLLLDDASLTLTPYQSQPISLPKLNAQINVAQNTAQNTTRVNLSFYSGTSTKALDDDLKTQLTLDINANTAEATSTRSQASIQRAQIYVHSKGLEIAPWLSLIVPTESPFYTDSLRIGGELWLDYQANKPLQLVTKKAHLQLLTPMGKLELTGDVTATLQLDRPSNDPWGLSDWAITAQALSGQINNLDLPFTKLQVIKNKHQLLILSPKLHLAKTQKVLSTIKRLPEDMSLPITSLAPSGWLKEVQLHLDLNQPLDFLVIGKMQKASIKAWTGVPQVSHADGTIWLNRYGGKVAINDLDGVSLHVSVLKQRPWQFNGIQGEFNWHYDALALRFSSSNITAKLDQGHANLQMAGSFPRKDSPSEPFLQLVLGMQNLDVSQLPAMLPDKVLDETLGAWIAKAAPVGTVTEAAFIYNGSLDQITSAADKMTRTMPIAAHVEVPSFTYHPQWPQVKSVIAKLAVNHERALIQLESGLVSHGLVSVSVQGWQAEVPIYPVSYPINNPINNPMNDPINISNKELKRGYIKVQGQLSGAAKQMVTLAEQLPLNINLPSWLHSLKPEGDISLQGDFGIAFGHQAKATYEVHLSSDNLNAFWAPLQADLRHLQFNLELSSDKGGIGAISGNGLVDGQAIRFKRLSKVELAKPWLSNIPDPILHHVSTSVRANKEHLALQFEGHLSPNYLTTKINQPWAKEIPGALPFVARFSTCIQAQEQCNLLSAKIDLSKAGIELPEPLSELQQLQLVGNWQQDQQDWYVSIDKHQMAIKLGSEKASKALSVLGVNVGFDQPVDWAQTGQWHIDGQLDSVDMESWWRVYQTRIKSWVGGQDKQPSTPIVPLIDVTLKHATWFGFDTNQTQITLQPLAQIGAASTLNPWRLNIVSENLTGNIDYLGAQQPVVINVDHALLLFPEPVSQTTQLTDVLDGVDPGKLIDADISINNLVKNGESFGAWEFKTRRMGNQVFVHDLAASIRHSQLQGNLIWGKTDGIHHTHFTGRVESNDMASMLKDWGYDPGLTAQTAAIEVQLDWPRSPLAFTLKETSGDLGLRLKQGSISSAPDNTQGLKVLALFDISRLIDRLRLDFSDILQPGFNFDSITAHYRFDQGIASTVTPSIFKSSTLNLTMDGWIDFEKRHVDNNLIITLPVADKLPLVALIAGLPQLGSMIYIINKLIGDELATFTSARYHVVGPLDEPEVKLVRFFDKDYQSQSVQERLENVITID